MSNRNDSRILFMNRRNFIKTCGLSAATLPMTNFMITDGHASERVSEAPLPPLKKVDKTEYETDVLVIGGGYAGLQAAMSARSKGQKVILVDKAITGKSGFSPWANTFCFYDERLGDKRDEWILGVQTQCEYMVNLDYYNQFMDDSLSVYKELVEWGIINRDNRDRHLLWPKVLKDSDVELVQRVMITNLLVENGAVRGAIGFPMESKETIVFKAKAIVLCAGAGGYKAPGYPIHNCTFDGDAMVYRIGATIGGKEWVDFHTTGDEYPADVWTMWSGEFVNRVYETPGPRVRTGFRIGSGSAIAEIHENGYPSPSRGFRGGSGETRKVDQTLWENIRDYSDAPSSIMPEPPIGNSVQGAATGLGIHATEGVWPVDLNCWSGIPGLYAAGDALSSRICGALYPTIGTSSASAACLGRRAGRAAGEYAAQTGEPKLSRDQISRITENMVEPLKRKTGFGPRWTQEVLLTTMAPYYILKMKEEGRLNGALSNVMFLQEHIVPKLRASDPHELRLVHETKNMVLNAEMRLRASLMRKESRGSHYRADYPYRDDNNWLAWTTIKKGENGEMVVDKEEIPERMKTNNNLPYAEKYIICFPGEEEAIAKLGIK